MSDFTIMLGINNPDDADLVGAAVPVDQRYLVIPNGFDGTISWQLNELDESTANAVFDNPPLTVNGNQPNAMLVAHDPKGITVHWINDSAAASSYYYTIQLVVTIDGNQIPISHDPTVHNDPPTP